MPARIRVSIVAVFGQMVVLAILEVLSILSLTFLAMSVGAPQAAMESPPGRLLLRFAPWVLPYMADLRNVALISSVAVVVLIMLRNIATAVVGTASSRLGERISLYAGKKIFHHYLHSPYMWHLSGDSTAMFQALNWRGQLGGMMLGLMNIYTYGIISVALFIMLVDATPGILMGVLAVVGILSFALYRTLKNTIDRSGITVTKYSADETRTTLNAVNGIREVLIYRQQPVFFKKLEDAVLGGMKSRVFLSVAPPAPSWVLEVVGFATIPITLWIMVTMYDAPMPQIAAALAMIMLAVWRILPLFNRALGTVISVRSMRAMAMNCLERLEYIDKNPASSLPSPDPEYSFECDIALEKVSFRYPGASSDVLHEISMRIPKGGQIGIIGVSGAGKSTLAGILSGLMNAASGAIKVDGKPLTREGLAAYTMSMGYVPQSPYIMAGTVAENVAFSQWGKPWDEAKVKAACEMAAMDIVEMHEKGIMMPLGERGAGLSGGQAQRVSIARALYTDPSLLILDEATSALDQGTEAAIMSTINALKGKITTIIIAHRLSTVAGCDEVIWLEGGRLVEQGSPAVVLPRYERWMREKNLECPQ